MKCISPNSKIYFTHSAKLWKTLVTRSFWNTILTPLDRRYLEGWMINVNKLGNKKKTHAAALFESVLCPLVGVISVTVMGTGKPLWKLNLKNRLEVTCAVVPIISGFGHFWAIQKIFLSCTCGLCFRPVMIHDLRHLSPFCSGFSDQSWFLGRAHTPPGAEGGWHFSHIHCNFCHVDDTLSLYRKSPGWAF